MNTSELTLLFNHKIIDNGLAFDMFGNAGIRDGDLLYIKPSGVCLNEITPEDISIVDIVSGNHVGGLKPSSDTPTYLELLRHYSDINSIIHTHSVFSTCWAQSQRSIPCLGTTHADYWNADIPITRELCNDEIYNNYESSCGKVIIEKIEELGLVIDECPGILLRNHGPFVWGRNINDTFRHAVLLEYISELAFRTLSLDPDASAISHNLHSKHFDRKHGSKAYYGQ
jgi:L-ribulose-5-phosphate 4-epimerase